MESRFVSSGRFRVNANKKSVDVWLIYRCAACGRTWNMTVSSRQSIQSIPAGLLEAYTRNDPMEAFRVASCVAITRRAGVVVEPVSVYDVIAAGDMGQPLEEGLGHIRIEVPLPLGLRLDRLLATELGLTRSALERWARGGRLVVVGQDSRRALRRPVRDCRLILSLGGLEARGLKWPSS